MPLDSGETDEAHLIESEFPLPASRDAKERGIKLSGTSWGVSALIVVNAALGAGLLNFPKAFDDTGGIACAMFVHVVLLCFAIGSLLILGWCSDVHGSKSYQDTVGDMIGAWARRLASALIALYCYGTCVAFLVIVGDQSDRVFYDKLGSKAFCLHKQWFFDRRLIVSVLSICLIFPFCFAKKIDFLKYASGVATLGVFYLVFLAIFVYTKSDTSQIVVKKGPKNWTDIFLVIPAICFGYQCHVSVIPVYSCIRPHSLWNFSKTIAVALAICFLSYSFVGIFGYLTFGSGISQDLLSSYDTNHPTILVAYVIFAIKTFLTYPILLFCGRIALESLMNEFSLDQSEQAEKKRRFSIGAVWFTSSVLIGIFVPNITVIIDYLGSFAAIFIFVFPGICLLKRVFLFEETLVIWKQRLGISIAAAYTVFGIFLFGITLAQGIELDLNVGKTKGHNLCD